MNVYSGENIRNIAVLGHSGSGKTTVLEVALHVAGLTKRIGKVEEGNTVGDFDQEEINRGVSINASSIPVEFKNVKINFIDTPGYFDFVGEVKQALSAADVCLIIVDAKSGVEVGTEKSWRYCKDLGIPKIIFINGMDDEHASFENTLKALNDKFGKSIVPIALPKIEGEKFTGIISVVSGEGDEAEEARLTLSEAVAETSEERMDKFFNEEPFTEAELAEGIKDGIKSNVLAPVMCGSASLNVGVAELLESIIKFVPSPKDFNGIKAKSVKTGEEIALKCDDNESLAAFVFKTIADPYVGRLNLFRVFSGVLKKDSLIYNARSESGEKIGALYVMRGKEQIPVAEIRAGDIGAVAKMSGVLTGDTFSAKENPLSVKEIDYPKSYMSYAVYPKGKGEEDKLSGAISKLLEEDRTLEFEIDRGTKESIIRGVGDNQIDIAASKLKNKYKIEVDLKTPRVPYREFIKGKAKVQSKYKKQSGGHGQYGDVHLEFEPSGDLTTPFVFEEKIFGGAVPKNYFPAVEKGIADSVKAGPLAGYPVVGVKVTLVDGSYHPVDSSEMAFKTAASMGFKDGFMKSKPGILEPIQKLSVTVPDEYTGDVMGDLNKRRGRILGMEKVGEEQVIHAEVPLAELFKYPTDLRSTTQGRGYFVMTFERYDEAGKDIEEKVIAAAAKEKESK